MEYLLLCIMLLRAPFTGSVCLIILFTSVLIGQRSSVNNPFIVNYTKHMYEAGTENWDVACDAHGRIFIANNEGLLSYNGYEWSVSHLPNKTIVRSVEIDTSNQRLYVGGQDEVGFYSSDEKGCLSYTSIRHHLPKTCPSLEDVWDLQIWKKNAYFRSVNKIFKWDGTTIQILPIPSLRISFLKVVDNKLLYFDSEKGLYDIRNDQPAMLAGSEVLRNTRVSDILVLPNKDWLIVTEKNGIYRFDGKQCSPFLQDINETEAIFNSAVLIDPKRIAVATVRKGILFFDLNGRFLYQISREQGLQTNSIIRLGTDATGNLWACTSNGIDKVLIQSPFTIMYPDLDLQGGVYAVKKHKGKLYVGTNNGLYYTEWQPASAGYRTATFKEVANSSGQVWGLDVVGEDLFMGHNEGSYQIIHDRAVKLTSSFSGTWCHISFENNEVMLAGTYGGIERFVRKGGNWVYDRHLAGFEESARITVMDDQKQLWVSHPYRGVYKLVFTKDGSEITKSFQYDASHGLPSKMNNYVSKLNQQVYVCNEKGIYFYDEKGKKFNLDGELSKLIGSTSKTRRLFQENGHHIWFLNEQECGYLQIQSTPVSREAIKQMMPFLKGKLIGGFENIYIPDDLESFICTDRGLILADNKKLDHRTPVLLHLNKVFSQGIGDSVIYGGFSASATYAPATIPYLQNNLGIVLGTNHLDDTEPVLYSWMLEGRNSSWSAWQSKPDILLTHLKPGKYTFVAKAMDKQGNESDKLTFTFTILRPWYASWPAITLYFLLVGALFYTLVKYLDKKHEGEKTQLIQEKEESEALVKDLLNQKLQTEIEFKNKELALSTMHIVQKNETLTKLREELTTITKHIVDPDTKKQIRKVISILSDDQVLEGDWESFAYHFDQVHSEFIRRLKEAYPQLSPKDLKLCAYLRLNLSTKELAPLLNISVRGVEISRYRLRKKLNLTEDINLNDFMMNY
jgi:ligand-binding sensor domain-containing protein